jgi:TonB family protein
MKTALFLFLLLSTLSVFSQSKKTMNRMLLQKQVQLVRQNDSIVGVINNNSQKLREIDKSFYNASRNLQERKMEFTSLKRDVTNVQKKLVNLGADPNTLVRQQELDVIYERYDDFDYQKEIKDTKLKTKPVYIGGIEDLSAEKIKVQNERLTRQNLEYSAVIDSNLRVVKNQEELIAKMNNSIQKMETVSAVLIKDNRLLKEKYELLQTKSSELELKKEQAEIAAENAKKELIAKKVSKKTKGKTVRFVPPVITDEIEPYPEVREMDENAGFDIMPPPVIREEKIIKQEPEIYQYVDETASFPGGREALSKYLQEKIIYPQIAKDAGISGKVYLKFVVSEQGTISNVKIMRGIADCKECDQEAIRVVKNMPKWIPAKNNGKAVNSYYNLPVLFKL